MKVFHDYWVERESEIEKLFSQAEDNSDDKKKLVEFLEGCEKNFDDGCAFGSKQKYPYNVNIMAITLDRYILYHNSKQMRSRKLPPDHPAVSEIIQKRNGIIFWPNNLRGKLQFQIKGIDIGQNPRFTKIYFREITRLGVIIIFESHITIFPYLLNIPLKQDSKETVSLQNEKVEE